MFIHPRKYLAAMALAIAAALAAPSASVQAAERERAADPYEAIIANLQNPQTKEATLKGMLEALANQVFAQSEDLARIEAEKPQIRPDFKAALKPVFAGILDSNMATAHERFVALMRERLTPEEAGEVAAFYADPVMQRMIATSQANNDYGEVLAPENADGPITAEQLEADRSKAVKAAASDLSPTEKLSLALKAAGPGLRKFLALRPELSAINVEIENRDLTPEQEEAMLNAMIAVFTQYGLYD